jgi:glyoxylase I family protein
MMNIETLHHIAVPVSDLARSKAFYSGVLGLKEIPRPAFSFGGAWYGVGDREVHLIVAADPTFRHGKGIDSRDGHLALRVNSFRGALEHLESKGYRHDADDPLRSIRVNTSSPTGYPQLYVMDPDRNVIEINAQKVD